MSPRRTSYGHIHHLRAEVNRLIELLIDEPAAGAPAWQPPLDVIERDDCFEILIELPGVLAEEIVLELCDQRAVVRGTKRRLAGEPPGQTFHLMERFMGPFQVIVDLPRPIQPSRSAARMQQGTLIMHLPKLVDRRHRSFSIPVHEEEP